jgi:hypothetical protein
MSKRASYPSRRPAAPIRIVNTRTGRTTIARGGKDAALIMKVELDRRSGIAAQHDEMVRVFEENYRLGEGAS